MDKVRRHTDLFVKDGPVIVALEGCAETFSVSRALLLSASEYFRKALSNGFAETSEQTLRLPGCDEETFRFFLYYMTTNTLPDFGAEFQAFYKSEHTVEETAAMRVQFQVALVRIWCFGDIYLMPKLQNAAVDRLLDLLKQVCIAPDAVRLAFSINVDGPLCKLFAQEAAFDYNGTTGFKKASMDRLGAIPGFICQFTDAILYCHTLEAPAAARERMKESPVGTLRVEDISVTIPKCDPEVLKGEVRQAHTERHDSLRPDIERVNPIDDTLVQEHAAG
ncbi:hypothetical protein PRZ48_007522 [Zasmidium cellare]|uniref:BTB domain-containing protein n=1 Tax=Zasmidium cellare TaxID=395010 RepID=A0ABR0ELP9_ZASCE|nr:hypothetical protein PRZ48_007522 [Zasmidium cellare]